MSLLMSLLMSMLAAGHAAGQARLPPPAQGVDASPGAVRNDDSRTLLELEKLRMARERRDQQAETRAEKPVSKRDLRAAPAANTGASQCGRLRRRVDSAAADLASARARHAANSAARARQRLRRARASLAAGCPA